MRDSRDVRGGRDVSRPYKNLPIFFGGVARNSARFATCENSLDSP